MIHFQRGVAQLGSAPGLGPGGREFESRRPDHQRQSRIHWFCARSSSGQSTGLLSRGLQVRVLPGVHFFFSH